MPEKSLESKPVVVLVNDDKTQLALLRGLLRKEGLEVRAFDGAERALEAMVRDGPPDLVVTDLYMPGIDGWRFCRLLRSAEYRAFNELPVLVVSATFAGEEASCIAADLGADAFLPAPVDRRRFLETVRALLKGERPRQRLRVLIVEDARVQAALFAKAFSDAGYEARTASAAGEAAERFAQVPFDVAVIDYHLPDGRGDVLLERFQALRPQCVCVMTTADPDPKLALSWMKQGAAAYLRKPFEPEYLLELCAQARRERALLRVEDLLEERTRELRHRLEMETLLKDAAADMTGLSADKADEGIHRALERVGRFTGADRACVFRLRGGGRRGENTHEWCARGIASQKDLLQGMELEVFPWWKARLEKLEEIVVPRVALLPPEAAAEKDLLESQGVRSLLVVPLVSDGAPAGFLSFESLRSERAWSREDLSLFRTMGDVVAGVLLRREAEVALLRKSRERRLLLDTIPTQVWYLTDTETYGALNRAHADFLGFSPKDVAYKRLDEFLPPQVARACKRSNGRVFETRKPLRTEEWVFDARGERRLLDIVKTPKLDEAGEVEYVICQGTDVTDRRYAENLFQSVYRLAPLGIEIFDASGKLRAANPHCLELFGIADEGEIAGFDLFRDPNVTEEAKERLRRGETVSYESVFDFEKVREAGLYLTHRRGTMDVSVSITPLEQNGFKGAAGYLVIVRDITEKKRSRQALTKEKERLRQVLEGTRAGTWEWNVRTGETVFNERWAEIVGYTLDELRPLSIETWASLCHPEDLEKSGELLRRHFSGELDYYENECRMRHKSGRWVWVQDRGKVVERDENGEPVRMTGTHIDVTEAKRVEAERFEYERRVQQLRKFESLSRMAGAVAHNFNNQLGAVLGNLELALDEESKGGPVVDFLGEALKATRRAAEVSGQMLVYLGQTAGKPLPTDLSETCLEALPLLRASMSGDVVLEADFSSPGPVVRANRRQIQQQVLAQMVVNAREAMKDEGVVRLAVGTAKGKDIDERNRFPLDFQPEADDSYAVLEVADTGEGIAAEDVPLLFDPFYSTRFAGRGLGLSLALGVVRPLGGCVVVESEPGRGSVFRVFLPLSSEAPPRSRDEKAASLQAPESGFVLLVEDEDSLRHLARAMLENFGFRVIAAKDGVEAAEIFRRRRDEVLLAVCDLTMPRMNGWETLEALRKERPDLPAVLVSGYDEGQVMAEGHAASVQVFLQKPYSMAELKAAVAKALAGG